MKSNYDLLAAMAGGNPASSNAVNKTKRTASVGTTASSLDSKTKTTAGICNTPRLHMSFVVSLEM